MTELSLDDRTDDELYTKTLEALGSPRPVPVTSTLFVVLMLVFAAGAFINIGSVSGVLLLIAVVVVHETGHAVGMRMFGFRDVRMFFIPFFGAAVSGRARGASAWKEAIVSLMGPLPGIFAGVALMLFAMTRTHPSSLPFQTAEILLFLNAFNLLPFGFLDGGRFLERVLFSRHRVLEIAFQAFGCLLLGFVALKGSMYILGFFAVASLFALPARWRILSAATTLRKQLPDLVPDPDRWGEAAGRPVFDAAKEVVGNPERENATVLAQTMESLLQALKPAPGMLASIGLLMLYGVGLACAIVGIALTSVQLGPVNWQVVERPGWRAEFPRDALAREVPAQAGSLSRTEWRAIVDGTERFTVSATNANDDSQWMTTAAEELAQRTATTITQTRPIDVAGRAGLEFELTAPNRVVRARMVASSSMQYQVVASAPEWGVSQQRFLDSFSIIDPPAQP